MRQILLTLLASFTFLTSYSQYQITGKIASKNEPVAGASISIAGSYYGATADSTGRFSFHTPDSGTYIIIVTMIGHRTAEKSVHISKPVTTLDFDLKPEITEMNAVVITAGTFEASDKKRTTVLKSIDVVTTAGQQADIVAALKTLPGAQQVGEQEGLFVRGGTGAETKVFIDGMMVTNPFFSSVPGIAQRARFSPLLFKGTVFSSGGYSAQYGQGLSSALILESIDLPSRSEVNMIISSAQMSVMGQKLNKAKNSSAGINVHYSNLQPYFSIISQKYDYSKAPEALNAEFNYRRKIKGGIIKLYMYANTNVVGFARPYLDNTSYAEHFHIKNKNLFSTATFTQKIGIWSLYAGTSFSYNYDDIKIQTGNEDNSVFSFFPQIKNRTAQAKVTISRSMGGLSRIYVGTEYQNVFDEVEAADSITKRNITDNYLATFIESDIYFSQKLVARTGVRIEHSSLLNKSTVSPRVSLAYKLTDKSQFSFAYGSFIQKPEANQLWRSTALNFTKATHYILNFQKVHNGQTFRAEAFYKNYQNLITTTPALSNDGHGYAKGFEIFWRDRTTVKGLDYWIAYSFLDTKRKHMDFSSLATPPFAAKHTLNVVAKSFINAISTNVSATYTYASGRTYFNPNKIEKDFMTDKTRDLHSLGLQLNYLRTFGNINAVFIVNVSNVLGSEQVFGYRYASQPNMNNEYTRDAITPMAKRFVFAGVYLSIGSDKRQNILD